MNQRDASQLHQNGTTPAPHNPGGAFFVTPDPHPHPAQSPTDSQADPSAPKPTAPKPPQRPTPTVFPPDITNAGWDSFLYAAARTQIAGFPLLNWLLVPLIVATLIALLRSAWSIAATLCLTALLLRAHLWLRMRKNFVHFTPTQTGQPPVDTPHTTLDPRDKLPIHVTGCLDVNGKVQRFTFLPGFYRTFATREHALLCLCRPGPRTHLGSWPEAETGVWYAFFQPQAIRNIQHGTLHFGSHHSHALAIEIDTVPTRGRIRRKPIETLYLAADPTTLGRIRHDLVADAPPHALPTPGNLPVTPTEQTSHPTAGQQRHS